MYDAKKAAKYDDTDGASIRTFLFGKAQQLHLLTKEEEISLANAIADGKASEQYLTEHPECGNDADYLEKIRAGKEARDQLVQSNMGLVMDIAGNWFNKNYHNDRIEMEDLVQEGMIGLLKAVGELPRLKSALPPSGGASNRL